MLVNYMLVLLQLLVWAAFAAATFWYFGRPEGTPPLMKALSFAGMIALAASVFGTLKSDISSVRAIISLAFFILSAALFFWVSFFLRRSRPNIAFTGEPPEQIETGGPFRISRHPFYTSYLLCWIGCGFAVGWPLGLIPSALMLPFYILAARQEERYMLEGENGNVYRLFMDRTGRFLPFAFLGFSRKN